MQVVVNVFLKNGVLDPQGKALEKALHSLNFSEVKEVRVAKQLKIELDESDTQKARGLVAKMCEELLVSSVIEDYEILL
ncbi:phosphoribosylformylglycinamidine synthase subunit PurS [Campylobacter upsaliensis]|uniref:phosphoribosylformylglycinamidine synthase subunit PurS n=1 Tax=Campylobacter upsaliensis TaxID=28080 RepID=UPI0022EB4306|nr:phosphoribosylformylglycinamidine synthase subunit PurS [Campylobacter upsaliensis]